MKANAVKESVMSPLLLVAGLAHAETLTLSYPEALSRALERNPTLKAAGADLEAADGALLASRGVFDPSLTGAIGLNSTTSEGTAEFGAYSAQTRVFYDNATLSWFAPSGTTLALGWSHSSEDFTYDVSDFGEVANGQVATSLRATVTQALLQGWRMSYNLSGVRYAERARDSAEATLSNTRQEVLSSVATAYWALWEASATCKVAEQTVAVTTEEQRVVAAKVAAGALASVEQTRVDAQLVEAKSALLTAQTSRDTARDALLVLLGMEPGAEVVLATDPADPAPTSLDGDTLVQTALEHNPTLATMVLSEEQAEDDLSVARQARMPEVNAVASYSLSGYEGDFAAATGEMLSGALPAWGVGATISVPLGNRVDRGSALSASANASSARLEREAYERTLKAAVLAQARAVQTAASQVEMASAKLRLAEQTLSAERALQEVGRALQKDVLEAIKDVDSASVDLQTARADYALAIVALEALKGTL